jgi:hypothetical protein
VTSRLTTRIHAMLERHLPEQRLFLKSDDGTRFIRLRPATQAALIGGLGLFVGWTIIVTSIFLIDTISAGNVREQAQREEMRVQERLSELELVNDRRAAEVRQAQERFALAMDQVSGMQTRLLDSEERRRELETAIDVIQLSLRDMRQETGRGPDGTGRAAGRASGRNRHRADRRRAGAGAGAARSPS